MSEGIIGLQKALKDVGRHQKASEDIRRHHITSDDIATRHWKISKDIKQYLAIAFKSHYNNTNKKLDDERKQCTYMYFGCYFFWTLKQQFWVRYASMEPNSSVPKFE